MADYETEKAGALAFGQKTNPTVEWQRPVMKAPGVFALFGRDRETGFLWTIELNVKFEARATREEVDERPVTGPLVERNG